MITLDQARAHFAARDVPPDAALLPVAAARPQAPAFTRSLLHGCLFLTILISPLVFIEPSPYEVAVGALAFACLLARVPLVRHILPLILLLVLWNVSGAVALAPLVGDTRAVTYVAVSFYLAFSAIIFASIFAEDTLHRLSIMRRAYILAALAAATTGVIGYFNIGPFADQFLLYGRARGTFKDPNVYGPFLVLPMLLLIENILSRGIRLLSIGALCWIAFGLLLSFSRGAWAHFVLSAVVMLALMFVTAPDIRSRARLTALALVAAVALAGLFVGAMSSESVGTMLKERARVVQDYDVGSGGRFTLQELATNAVLENPLGMGPFEFNRIFGLQQHNVYLQAFLVYGWAGGLAYVAAVLLTMVVGLRTAFVRSPWQPYAIAATATFIGVAAEGFIIDSDHWRHFFLLLGLIWGLFAATSRFLRTPRHETATR